MPGNAQHNRSEQQPLQSKILSADDLTTSIADLLKHTPQKERKILAIAGAPGSGKSTLVDNLSAALNADMPGGCAILPMDGFHFDDEVLVPRGWRSRKGAPHTFDVGGLRSILQRLRENEEDYIAVPRFDRSIEIARAGAQIVDRSARLILVEGNYLLLDDPPWADLAPLFDKTILIDVPEETLERRLRGRWVNHGLDEDGIRQKLEENDLPNGRLVYRNSRAPDFILKP